MPPNAVLIDRSFVAGVLMALPPTARSLELEFFLDDAMAKGLCPACKALRELLPRLHHLRLRISHVCPQLLAPFTNDDETPLALALQTASIWLSTDPEGYDSQDSVKRCDGFFVNLSWVFERWGRNPHALFRELMLHSVQRLCLLGNLPDIREFHVLEIKSRTGNRWYQGAVIVADIVRRETCAYPVDMLSPYGEGLVPQDEGRWVPVHVVRLFASPEAGGVGAGADAEVERRPQSQWRDHIAYPKDVPGIVEGAAA
jgi:hypothetical protein